MSFLLKWLRGEEKVTHVGLRPRRDVELPLAFDAAYDRCLEAIELTLGANVMVEDRKSGFIEAAFGLVNNERVRCTLERSSNERTIVRIEAIFPAGSTPPQHSRAVDAMAFALEADKRA